jgi:hypothetical protein
MAIDPRISMGAQAPNLQSSLKLFQDTLNNIQGRKMNAQSMAQNEQMNPLRVQEAQQVVDSNDRTAATNRENQNIQSIASYAPTLRKFLDNGDNMGAAQSLTQRIDFLERNGRDPTESREALQAITNGNPDMVLQALDTAEREAVSRGIPINGQTQRQFAPEISPVQADPNTGQQYVVETDKNTGQSRRVDIPGAIQRTGAQTRETEVRQVNAVETEKGKVSRSNEIQKELGDRNRSAARAQRPLKQALTLIAKADQGVTGAIKLQLGKLIPGIDVSDEGQLDAVFNQLALEQLQQFKGPTTDFEFGVTQDIAGSISNAQTANLARVKSLDRNNWFNQREFTQFNNYIKNGNDPDGFAFNFQETLKTKKGDFTLQQLQDTAVSNNLTIEEVLGKLNNASN